MKLTKPMVRSIEGMNEAMGQVCSSTIVEMLQAEFKVTNGTAAKLFMQWVCSKSAARRHKRAFECDDTPPAFLFC